MHRLRLDTIRDICPHTERLLDLHLAGAFTALPSSSIRAEGSLATHRLRGRLVSPAPEIITTITTSTIIKVVDLRLLQALLHLLGTVPRHLFPQDLARTTGTSRPRGRLRGNMGVTNRLVRLFSICALGSRSAHRHVRRGPTSTAS